MVYVAKYEQKRSKGSLKLLFNLHFTDMAKSNSMKNWGRGGKLSTERFAFA
jgi:hypothetical protein